MTYISIMYNNRYRVDYPDEDEPGDDIEEVDKSYQEVLAPTPFSTSGPSFSAVTMIPNRPPPWPNEFCDIYTAPFPQNIQNQSDNHIPSDNGLYTPLRLPPQGVVDLDPSRRALPSFMYQLPQPNIYSRENGMPSRVPTPASASPQPLIPLTSPYRVPLPISEHQFKISGYLPQPSLSRVYFQE
ncbi:hypothetical protein OIDMADRAFT_36378 [Oidiodendron maius Zn]|uniref:Uncharacterized protein n=1 Tax=Oidiodendron maius (strain Zn) TaxID=913774 RepID=A0A0C3CSR0_OIDMZ|nr:hypothetical protein OIDMADRAFT_36378 [Oidiodendron maius Zn]